MIRAATWHTEEFFQGNAKIELTIHYQRGTLSMTHGNNDNNVTFNGTKEDFEMLEDRLKCVEAALKFAKQELLNKQ